MMMVKGSHQSPVGDLDGELPRDDQARIVRLNRLHACLPEWRRDDLEQQDRIDPRIAEVVVADDRERQPVIRQHWPERHTFEVAWGYPSEAMFTTSIFSTMRPLNPCRCRHARDLVGTHDPIRHHEPMTCRLLTGSENARSVHQRARGCRKLASRLSPIKRNSNRHPEHLRLTNAGEQQNHSFPAGTNQSRSNSVMGTP